MKSALTTLVPLFAAAAFIMLGGERLSVRKTEIRTAADRERLLDFADALRTELERLEQVFANHLDGIARDFVNGGTAPEEAARNIAGVDAAHLFTTAFPAISKPRREEFVSAPLDWNAPKLPEVQLEDGEAPFNPEVAVILPRELLERRPEGASGWIEAPGLDYRIRWSRPDSFRLVALCIRTSELNDVLDRHLQEWIVEPSTPLREAGEIIAVRDRAGSTLVLFGEENRGPAAMMLPFRTSLGEWQIQAWDRVTVTSHRDPATLAGAGTLAGFMILAGIMLFIQQHRAMRLAEERVSFVNRVSHDLGTPLTNLALNVDLAAEALDARPTEARRRLRIVTEEIERLGRLVANVLTFSRRERQTLTLDPQPCTPDDEISSILDSFLPALERRGIRIERDDVANSRVLIDPDAFGQIVGNLVSNVEKYATSGHLLRIESELANDLLTVRVRDQGPGIPAAARNRIFQPFERVHRKVNEGSSGTGLGLAIAHDLAVRMGGSLHLLDSESGATFELRLPAPPVLAVLEDNEHSAA